MPFATNTQDESRVYFEDDGGDGTPIMILGGFLDPIALVRDAPLARVLQGLTDEFRLVYVDHRGHGGARNRTTRRPTRCRCAWQTSLRSSMVSRSNGRTSSASPGARLCFGIGEHAPERVRSLVIIGQQPYAIRPDGPLARVVGEAMDASDERGIEVLVEAFEAIAGRYPESVRSAYLSCDAARCGQRGGRRCVKVPSAMTSADGTCDV